MAITQNDPRSSAALVAGTRSFLPVLDLLAEVLNRRHIRQSYGRLGEVQLRDLGLVPGDIDRALALPLWQSAEQALARAVSDTGRW